MEIFGIGPGEFILILIVLLVVVGPERLPVVARQIGQFLVRARNWLQTSPDAALVMRARAEIEAELASIKNSLMEVQVVRDEVLGAARQFEDSVNSITPPKVDFNSLVNPPSEPTIATNGQVAGASESSTLVRPDDTPTSTLLDQRWTPELPNGTSASIPAQAEAQPINGLNGIAHDRPEPVAAATPALGELESINVRLQAIMADMWALQQQLKQRGALDEAWQPPSLDVQLPTPGGAAPDAPPSPAEPAEDPVVLAARKRLEELTPMQVSLHAPPLAEPTPAESAPDAATAAELEPASAKAALPILVDPLAPAEPPAPKARKRRAVATAEPIQEAADTPANGAQVAKTRKRTAASTAEALPEIADVPMDGAPAARTRKRRTTASSDETEPVTTEKAS